MNFINGFQRNQLQIISYDTMLTQDSWARIVDLFVDNIPLQKMGFDTHLENEGRPPFHPADLLKLLLYGYKNKLRSSRVLAKSCKVNIEVNLMMTVYNLRRTMQIFDLKTLKNRLKRLVSTLFDQIKSFFALLSTFSNKYHQIYFYLYQK